jgi:D-alanyl-D-alanine carboxypeptidase
MTRALFALLLLVGQLPVIAATRGRAMQPPSADVPRAAIVAAARQAAQAALNAGVPAVQIAASHQGRIFYSEAFGVTDKVYATPATPHTILRIGSITKQFTAAAILRLAERGALSLDDRIEKYVPEFDPRGRTITIRHLLTHTSGVARDVYPNSISPAMVVAPYSREQAIQTLNTKPFDFLPGASWSYSNSGFMLLGYAIETITGRQYDEFMREEFVLPLGLLETGMCGTSNIPMPDGYSLIGTNWIRPLSFHRSGMLSSGSFCSTANDLVRWASLLAAGRAILPASYETMITPARLNSGNVVSNRYALGVSALNIHDKPAVSHGGAVNGFLSFVLYLTEQEIAIAVIVNAFPAPPLGNSEYMAREIAKAAVATP